MRALITGASGFVGHHLVDHLHDQGDEVIATDRSKGGPDLVDHAAIRALLCDAAPDVVYHLAGQSDVGASWDDPLASLEANTVGTASLLSAAREAGVGRVLAVTSADIYGRVQPGQLPLTEATELRPVSPYAASKAAADMVCLQAHLGWGQDVVRARSFNHLGPGQSPQFVAAALADRIARNELSGAAVVPVGNLSPRRDFTDVRDVVRAYRLLIEHGDPGGVYHVCQGVDIAIAELADQLVALARHPMRIEVDEALVRPTDLPVLCGDATRLREATGWTPSIPLERTLEDLLDDYRQRVAAETPQQETP